MADSNEPRDPFLDDDDPFFQGWGYSLRKGEMVFQALSELPSIHDATRALGGMSESDLKCMVLERLFKHHVAKEPLGWLGVEDWLSPPATEADDDS